MRTPVVCALALTVAACAEADDRPARWSYLQPAIIAPGCATATCHSAASAVAGLDLSSRTGAYTFLTGRICGEPLLPGSPPRNYVDPGSPEYSQLVYQLRGIGRTRMPPDTPLPEVEIALIERWIAEGATCE
jgi:hypothetical protein